MFNISMMRKMRNHNITAFLLACSVCGLLTGCSTEEETVPQMTETVPEITETVPETEPETIPETELLTESVTELATESEPETLPVWETEPEWDTTPETDDASQLIAETVSQETIPTNAECLQMIMKAFGMFSDGTFEGNLSEAAAWDIVDEDVTLSPDDPVTAEFLIASAMRATGYVTGDSSMDEILTCAVDKNVLTDADLSAVNLSDASGIIEKAAYAWTHKDFSDENNDDGGVILQDNVINLSEIIPESDVKIEDHTITIPAEYAKDITTDSVVIFPGENGGAYKIQKIGETDGTTVVIEGIPAQMEEVYKSINVSY